MKRAPERKAVGVGHQYHGDEAFGFAHDEIGIEFEQRRSPAHPLAFRAPNLKPLTVQVHGFDPNVNQDFHPFVGDKRNRMPFSVDLSDFPVARR